MSNKSFRPDHFYLCFVSFWSFFGPTVLFIFLPNIFLKKCLYNKINYIIIIIYYTPESASVSSIVLRWCLMTSFSPTCPTHSNSSWHRCYEDRHVSQHHSLLPIILTDLIFPPYLPSTPFPPPPFLLLSCPDARCAVPPSYHHHHHRSHAHSFHAPSYDRPAPERPSYDRPSFDRSIYDRPSFDRPSYTRPLHERPIYDRPTHDRPHHDHWNPNLRVSSGNQLYMLDQEEVLYSTHWEYTDTLVEYRQDFIWWNGPLVLDKHKT